MWQSLFLACSESMTYFNIVEHCYKTTSVFHKGGDRLFFFNRILKIKHLAPHLRIMFRSNFYRYYLCQLKFSMELAGKNSQKCSPFELSCLCYNWFLVLCKYAQWGPVSRSAKCFNPGHLSAPEHAP